MKTNRRKKRFDCVEFKRRAQAKIYKETRGLTPEEEIAYFRRAVENGPLAEWWKGIQHRTPRRSRKARKR